MECLQAMSEGFITIKEFGKVDLEIIKAAYLEKKGVQPDNGRRASRESKAAHTTCIDLQQTLEGDCDVIGELFKWNPRKRPKAKNPDEDEEYFDPNDEWLVSLRNEWGQQLAAAVLAERELCYKYEINYPQTAPWDEAGNQKLSPATAMQKLCSQLMEKGCNVTKFKHQVEKLEKQNAELKIKSAKFLKQRQSSEKIMKHLRKKGDLMCEQCRVNLESTNDL